MLPTVLLISVFGLLMRFITKSWGWYTNTLVAYLILLGLVFVLGSLENNGRNIALGVHLLNSVTFGAVVLGGGLVVVCTAIWRLLGSLFHKVRTASDADESR
jgi:hypothetical protein